MERVGVHMRDTAPHRPAGGGYEDDDTGIGGD
jgi:hypothetical protein